MKPLEGIVSTPLWIKKVLGWLVKLRGDNNTADSFLSISNQSRAIQTGIDRVYACRKSLLKKMCDEKIDLLLCPTTLSPAPPHSLLNQIPLTALMSTLLWNVMDWPAGVVTTGSWTEQDEVELVSYPEKGLVESGIKKGCKNSVGLPLSVQVVAPIFRDEMVLRVMVDLHDALKK
ncbi:hypothetical protein PENTCL1PPCAC_16734 [Pristionchus entomophagus]|uniref:Amidase domain-containing protein n=1 Tax=Pristionchus entomophagus TaxID=358040 RepID=A0AAV5TJR1_9BILA|nr:hypothetical protein PENTCL1PPCAC_16734 [Pristionchus entomophagus]